MATLNITPPKWKPPRKGTDAMADAVRDLDARIKQADAAADKLRKQRRDLRVRLRGRGWSWTMIAQLSGQVISAIQKDVALHPKPVRKAKADTT